MSNTTVQMQSQAADTFLFGFPEHHGSNNHESSFKDISARSMHQYNLIPKMCRLVKKLLLKRNFRSQTYES